MPDQASESRHVWRLDAQLDQLRTQFRRQQVLVAYGLVLASLRVPVVSFVNSPGSIESERETEHLFGAIGEYFGGDLDIGSRSTYPYAIPGGLSLTRIGLVVVLVGLVAVAVTLLAAHGRRQVDRKPRTTARPYVLRGLLFCGLCQRRMQGTWNNGRAHYRCNAGGQQGQANDGHPRSLYVREEIGRAHV